MSTISSHQGISHDYLSAALAKLTNNRQLDIRSVSPIGTGQMAESYRVVFSEPIAQSSNSVVVKVPSQSQVVVQRRRSLAVMNLKLVSIRL